MGTIMANFLLGGFPYIPRMHRNHVKCADLWLTPNIPVPIWGGVSMTSLTNCATTLVGRMGNFLLVVEMGFFALIGAIEIQNGLF